VFSIAKDVVLDSSDIVFPSQTGAVIYGRVRDYKNLAPIVCEWMLKPTFIR